MPQCLINCLISQWGSSYFDRPSLAQRIPPMLRSLPSSVLYRRAILAESSDQESFRWTAAKIVLSVFLFVAAGLCEIGGGWLVWKAIRGGVAQPERWFRSLRALSMASVGCLVLVGYGFLPTLQPPPTFGRLYAVYGGIFIVLSYLWGWTVDKDRPDRGMAPSLSCVRYSIVTKPRTIKSA